MKKRREGGREEWRKGRVKEGIKERKKEGMKEGVGNKESYKFFLMSREKRPCGF
jgi:hypothetical protein